MVMPESPGFAAARTSQSGDICVMLAADEIPDALQKHLGELQRIVGGCPPDRIHVTLQRFEVPDPLVEERLLELLYQNTTMNRPLEPFQVCADGFLPVHSDFRNLNLLKWRVPASPELERAFQWVDEVGIQAGATPIYARQTGDAMVTAMLDIFPEKHADLEQVQIPDTLFLGCRLVTSQIQIEEDGSYCFNILGESRIL